MKHSEFICCHTVMVIKNIDNVFEYEPKGLSVLGQFLDLPTAELFRASVADSFEHGDRVIIISVYPEKETAEIDVLVIVESELN